MGQKANASSEALVGSALERYAETVTARLPGPAPRCCFPSRLPLFLPLTVPLLRSRWEECAEWDTDSHGFNTCKARLLGSMPHASSFPATDEQSRAHGHRINAEGRWKFAKPGSSKIEASLGNEASCYLWKKNATVMINLVKVLNHEWMTTLDAIWTLHGLELIARRASPLEPFCHPH